MLFESAKAKRGTKFVSGRGVVADCDFEAHALAVQDYRVDGMHEWMETEVAKEGDIVL